ncbi:MAG: efflux RND transporter permease subunit [Myxococcota bacterium]
MKLVSLCIRRPVFAVMLIAALVVLGFVSLGRLQVSLNPDVEFPFVSVTTFLRGASPETVESEVTDRLEEQINSIAGIRSLQSFSSQGLSRVMVEFEMGSEVAAKAQEVRDKVAAARRLLPEDAEDPVVEQLDLTAGAIVDVMLAGDRSIRDLSELADRRVKQRLERLDGVGNVRIVGAREREVRIWVDPVRLAGYGLAVDDVASMLRRENAEMGGGRVEGRDREWSVTTAGKVRTVDDFRSLIVAERGRKLVYLRDVAVVEDGMEDQHSIARLNGHRGVMLEVRRRSGTNTVAVARRVRAEVAAIAATLPPGMQVALARDRAIFIESSIDAVFDDLVLGGVLAVVVVLLFLRSPRSTLIAAVSIPTSIIASFTLSYAAGFTLNNMTLMALSLAVGLVIDDAIVVVENVVRHLEGGVPPVIAADRGAAEVGLSVVSTTLAVCAVFVPIAFMSGMMGAWFYEFGLVVAFAVCVSTLVALTLVPMLSSRLLTGSGVVDNRFFRGLERGHRAIESVYSAVAGAAMRRRWTTVAVATVTMLAGCGLATTIPLDMYSSSDRGEFEIALKMPLGTPLAATNRATRRIEAEVARYPEVRTVFATVGPGLQPTPNESLVFVGIGDKRTRERSQFEIIDAMRASIRAVVPEADEIRISPISWFSRGGRSATLQYALQGPDIDRLAAYAQVLVERMAADPGFIDEASSFESGRPEIDLELDRDRAAELGVPAVAVGRAIRTLLAGEEVGTYDEDGRRIPVRVQVLPEYRDAPAKLDLIRLRSLAGDLVPIPNVAQPRLGEGAVEIVHENRARKIELYANLSPALPLGVAAERLESWARELGVEPPYALAAVGRAKVMREAAAGVLFAFLLALVAIYMILASLFNSVVQPLVIMISAPLSFIGGFLALKAVGISLEMMSMIGFLVLMGLVMKNGILVVDFANRLRERGESLEAAALEAGRVRMRPVLMTTGALIVGLLPVALGVSPSSEIRRPLAVITIGGLLTSTLLTLVFVPVFYTLLDAFARRVRRLASRFLPSGATPESGSAGAYERATGIGGS